MIKLLNANKIFHSFEGEGKLIGTKTLFFTYDPKGLIGVYDTDLERAPAIYICTSEITDELLNFINEHVSSKIITLDIDSSLFEKCKWVSIKCNFFLKVKNKKDFKPTFSNKTNICIKVEVDNPDEFVDMISVANYYSTFNFDGVYLMPMFIENIGMHMSDCFDIIDDKVKTMPPTQLLIDIN